MRFDALGMKRRAINRDRGQHGLDVRMVFAKIYPTSVRDKGHNLEA